MIKGNISNRTAPIIAFNVDLLFMDNVDSATTTLQKLKMKMLTLHKSKLATKKLDRGFISIIDRLWNKYTYSIYFVNLEEDKQEELYSILDQNNVNYTSLQIIRSREELREVCELQYTYYFDKDEERLSYLSCNNALSIKELPTIIK